MLARLIITQQEDGTHQGSFDHPEGQRIQDHLAAFEATGHNENSVRFQALVTLGDGYGLVTMSKANDIAIYGVEHDTHPMVDKRLH